MRKIIFLVMLFVAAIFISAGIGRSQDGAPDRIIYLSASRFAFTPDHITVKQGQRIRLIATSTDVAHGIYISGYRASTEILPGQQNILEFTADKSGDFEFRCTVYCGSGHADMKGTLTVEAE